MRMTTPDDTSVGKCWELVKCKKCGYKFPAPAIRTDKNLYLMIDCTNYCPKCGADLHKLWELSENDKED